jgi:hypothetical protein
MQRALAAQEKYSAWLMALPHVVGVGVGVVHVHEGDADEVGLIVLCQADEGAAAPLRQIVPARLDGVAIDVQALGPFSAFGADG